jgi:predicted nucleic acid-binding protein
MNDRDANSKDIANILTEDHSHGQHVEGISIINPFLA